MSTPRLGDILISEQFLSEQQVDSALRSRPRNVLLGDYLIQQGWITASQLNSALEIQYNVQYVDLESLTIDPQVLRLIPESFARRRSVIAFGVSNRRMKMAMTSPDDMEAIAEVELMTGYSVQPYVAHEAMIMRLIETSYDDRHTARQTVVDMRLEELRKLQAIGDEQLGEAEIEVDSPVVTLVAAILNGAVDAAASDIHLEPHQPEMRVRYRIDGELQQVMTIPQNVEAAVIARIKVMADMNTTETRKAQDGRLSLVEHKKKVNYRVSSIPTVGGEKMVLRLLDEGSKVFQLEALGISDLDMAALRQVAEKPHGMFIVTGPTGSGKSTTLYALLSELNRVERNIVTVEDPVEYRLPGINQVQSNNEHGMGFVNALKYIMRQDPDVIMIGEIRDAETANLATQAALTGHLMISTLHTNDAPSAVVRLIDLGVDHFKIGGALLGSMAQRLVRRVCEHCREEAPINLELLGRLTTEPDRWVDTRFYHGAGCKRCLGTGYSGRTPVFEIMIMDEDLVAAVERQCSVSELRDLAKRHGMRDLRTAGLEMAAAGKTTLEEIYYKTIA